MSTRFDNMEFFSGCDKSSFSGMMEMEAFLEYTEKWIGD